MDAIWAEEQILNRQADLTADGVYRMTLLATGDEVAAQDAKSDRIMKDMRKQNRPET